jgi:hypothetical protein
MDSGPSSLETAHPVWPGRKIPPNACLDIRGSNPRSEILLPAGYPEPRYDGFDGSFAVSCTITTSVHCRGGSATDEGAAGTLVLGFHDQAVPPK